MLLTALPDVIAEEGTIARISREAANEIELEVRSLPRNEPTPTPPHPWLAFDGIDGDQFVAACRDVPAVRSAIQKHIPHVDAVNYLQSIPFRVNEHAMGVVRRGLLLKKVKTPGTRSLLGTNIYLADRFRDGLGYYSPFYVPLCVDFRGRLIAGTTLNFTGPDHIRGLFKFAKGEPITDQGIKWLKVSCATAYDQDGCSKQIFDERLHWADRNLEQICAAGRAPLDHLSWLGAAGDPIQCVALFHELANAREVGPGYSCTVPIGFDASCSALQHYALLARDRALAMQTNLTVWTDPPRPQDVYWYMLKPVRHQLMIRAERGDATARACLVWFDRKIAKAMTMTFCYSATPWGQADQIYDELRDRGVDIPPGAPRYLVALVREAIETHIKSAPAIMQRLQAMADPYGPFKEGFHVRPVRWTSPSGLPVANSYPKSRVARVRHYLHDGSHRCDVAAEWKPEQRIREARSAISPNFIHSLDSAFLALVACACEREDIPLLTVHDSFTTLPCYADRLREILLEELRGMYAGYWALVPPSGDLDLNEVRGPYAFS